MDKKIQDELKELQNLPEAERDENQQIRLKELNSWAEAEKTAEEKSKELASALPQKEHFRTKYEETEKVRKELEEKLKALSGNPPNAIPQDPIQVVKLAKALDGYSEEESELVLQFAKDKTPEAIIEATKNEWVQTAIQAKREKVAKEKQIPSPSSPSGYTPPEDAEKAVKEGKVADVVAKKVAEMEAKGRGEGA